MKRYFLLTAIALLFSSYAFSQSQPYRVVFDVTSKDTLVHQAVIRWLRETFSTNPNAFIYGLVFAEGANQWNSFKQYNPFDLNRSAGAGLRFLLPAFGLLGFDFGIGFDQYRLIGLPKPTTFNDVIKQNKFSIVLGFEPE